jgi:hypothetical protein
MSIRRELSLEFAVNPFVMYHIPKPYTIQLRTAMIRIIITLVTAALILTACTHTHNITERIHFATEKKIKHDWDGVLNISNETGYVEYTVTDARLLYDSGKEQLKAAGTLAIEVEPYDIETPILFDVPYSIGEGNMQGCIAISTKRVVNVKLPMLYRQYAKDITAPLAESLTNLAKSKINSPCILEVDKPGNGTT